MLTQAALTSLTCMNESLSTLRSDMSVAKSTLRAGDDACQRPFGSGVGLWVRRADQPRGSAVRGSHSRAAATSAATPTDSVGSTTGA